MPKHTEIGQPFLAGLESVGQDMTDQGLDIPTIPISDSAGHCSIFK